MVKNQLAKKSTAVVIANSYTLDKPVKTRSPEERNISMTITTKEKTAHSGSTAQTYMEEKRETSQ